MIDIRKRLGLTQAKLAERLGVSLITVNRWENGQSAPSRRSRQDILALMRVYSPNAESLAQPRSLDFAADPDLVRTMIEGERLSYGHLSNTGFGNEISLIEPLPHQRIAVYRHMLSQQQLRLLLADDAGAGKTIMAGLYVREMLNRRRLKRVLVVCPAGLTINWRRELWNLFGLSFSIASGGQLDNPFIGQHSDWVIVSLDTLAGEAMFARLRDAAVAPYDLVIFDEAHKLAADVEPDGTRRLTQRYRLAEALAVPEMPTDPAWRLTWRPQHLLLLTATPHMGKDVPYFFLWRLLRPDALPTLEAFRNFDAAARAPHFLRRTKEEMVHFDGRRMYPTRISASFRFDLAISHDGGPSEQSLYDHTTAFLSESYDRAQLANPAAARLALGVFQRRLASSAFALLCSLERRQSALRRLIADVKTNGVAVLARYGKGDFRDLLDDSTADEETAESEIEQSELAERKILDALVATTLAGLEWEAGEIAPLIAEARAVVASGREAKFERFREVLLSPEFRGEKVIVFTEHRDTLSHLTQRLEGLGYGGRLAQIHGGMPVRAREEQVARFRDPQGARLLVATDAAGEGINLQFAWLMINYDLPWNPARLEQRLGRIHRFGQRHDPVHIANLVAWRTREGRVMEVLLEKLDAIRREMSSDKVFDVVGQLLSGESLSRYMREALLQHDASAACADLSVRLSTLAVQAIAAQDRERYGRSGELQARLSLEREDLERNELRRLLPGYVRSYLEGALPRLGLYPSGNLEGVFSLRALDGKAASALDLALNEYPESLRDRLSVRRPASASEAIFLRPGEVIFESLRARMLALYGLEARRGAIFIDPRASQPYLLHIARLGLERKNDRAGGEAEGTLIGMRQQLNGEIQLAPIEALLLLRGAPRPTAEAVALLPQAPALIAAAREFAAQQAASLAAVRRQELAAVAPERERQQMLGVAYLEADLARQRTRMQRWVAAAENKPGERARLELELEKIKARQRELSARRKQSSLAWAHATEIHPGRVELLAHALVLPSADPEDRRRYDAQIEQIAVARASAHEESLGAVVQDVSTPALALAAGLGPNPGFDLWSRRPDGAALCIEVKGRAGLGDIELTENEWRQAGNHRQDYWLYVVFNCAGPSPRLSRVRDPFGKLLAERQGVFIDEREILRYAETEGVAQ